MSHLFDCTDAEARATGIASAISAVKSGRLVVLPTDTVYGIGADAFDNTAVAALLSAKGRGREMPVPVLVGSWHTIEGLVYTVPTAARELIRAFWPGALSLVVQQAPSLQWDLGDAAGTVMLRMPLHPVAIEVLREVGPMAVSSANVSGQPAAVTAEDARSQLGDLVEVYLDAGPSEKQAASTIVDLTGAHPRILRAGPVTASSIAEVLGVDADSLTDDYLTRAPSMWKTYSGVMVNTVEDRRQTRTLGGRSPALRRSPQSDSPFTAQCISNSSSTVHAVVSGVQDVAGGLACALRARRRGPAS